MSPTSPLRELVDRPAPGPHFTLIVELRDFLDVHLPSLTVKQRAAVLAWAQGRTCRQIAAGEGVTEEAIHARLSGGLFRLRQLAGEEKSAVRP